VNDRRPLIAIALILVIAVLPGLFLKRPPPPPPATADSAVVGAPVGAGTPTAAVPAVPPPAASEPAAPLADSAAAAVAVALPPEDTVVVSSALYEYRISTSGGRIVGSTFHRYRSMLPGDTTADGERSELQLIPAGESLLDDRLLVGGDTVRFAAGAFTPSATRLEVADGPATLTLTGTVGSRTVELNYTFLPDDYRIGIAGRIGGVGANGGTLLVGLGNGFADTEADLEFNHRESGIVTKRDGTDLTRFSSLDPLVPEVMPGPFEWVAVKSKYFVAGFFAIDSTRTDGNPGLIGGVIAHPTDTIPEKPVRARTAASLPVGAGGSFGAMLYLGPMEYDRLSSIGHDFDDVNPYGWPGFRTMIRPFAVAIRAVFVFMHETIGLHYGFAIIVFGILIRILLWPLNQKAMRSMTAMQAIQPQLKQIQERHKEDPQRLQQEMMKLYRENKVNPLGGCWPMLIPYPVLVAVFFVLQNTIELRGVAFMWMPDLSRADPLYIIPAFMMLSMYGLSKIGQMGMPPNPQAKMMMYVMPLMMGFLFANFASGLNLYYAVQNIASIPQQWLIMKERRKILPQK
jgi:YidC/Oxa1 family membrane protein insertase